MSAKPKKGTTPMPPRKPPNEHKQSMTVSIEPANRLWVRENFQGNGFRSESHLVDAAILLLKDKVQKEHRDQSSQRG